MRLIIDTKLIILFLIIALVFISFCVILYLLFSSPSDFPAHRIIHIEKGLALNEIAEQLKADRIISSSVLFQVLVALKEGQGGIKAGDYFFKEPISLWKAVRCFTSGQYGIEPIIVTIPEGATIKEIARIFRQKGFENFYIDDESLEGFLFPDTYFVMPNTDTEKIIQMMRENFEEKITSDMRQAIAQSGYSLFEIITMASLLEKEAPRSEDRKIISGILWKRLKADMPLQVDAVFAYIMSKTSFELTLEDLQIDSPYNTYRYRGLPKGPIANPGLDAILAAIFPEQSEYWYYLSDKEGNIHYAKTFEEHKINKAKYLRNP